MKVFFSGILVCLWFLMVFQPINAQESPSKQSTNQVELLRKKVEQQEAQLTQLQQALQHQLEIAERQQRLLESLQQRLDQMAVKSPASSETGSAPVQSLVTHEKTEKVAAKSTPQPTERIESGFGKIKFDGLLQGWYMAGDHGVRNTFRLRRTELKFTGQITPKLKWTVMVDLAKALSVNNTFTTVNGTPVETNTSVNQASRILQDAFFTYDVTQKLRVDFGQFRVPFGLEGSQSSGVLDTVERSLFASDRARGGTFGDVRDLGVMVRGGITPHVDYQIGVFNGSGENQNEVDKNNTKSVIGRLVVRPPFLKGLQIGVSEAFGDGQRADSPRRDRTGADILFKKDRLTFKSEFMTGVDGDMHRLGYYIHLGYKIKPKFEPIFRFDSWDPDTHHETNANTVTERDLVTGFNYFIHENNLKLQFNYVRKMFSHNLAPSRDLVLVNLQTSW